MNYNDDNLEGSGNQIEVDIHAEIDILNTGGGVGDQLGCRVELGGVSGNARSSSADYQSPPIVTEDNEDTDTDTEYEKWMLYSDSKI
ncbi:hypothetical protein PPL_04754 [Heterostelium album PN500]|uniref:Uncharacterized protein n=1 Tax=Heterostelium pallidum (strain ATCC 26659 / Pp 5 / PN500) TaxID=670386 RepID=D3B8G1_HETP5|nr:hypothetical protein PPL_04754 [Heterostelium album PN500]EFA82329.1 hypothetical protein PPL_04754 [Heterostelium album PN500]|eukprot:XP_020434446.1 hypothetical protein PPL_04754 [Heterostelium album PN500]